MRHSAVLHGAVVLFCASPLRSGNVDMLVLLHGEHISWPGDNCRLPPTAALYQGCSSRARSSKIDQNHSLRASFCPMWPYHDVVLV